VTSALSTTARRRQLISTTAGLTVGGLGFFLTLLNFTTNLTRTALAPGYFSHFFDLQARSLLEGRLSVPENSLGIEGFVHDGQTYTYFPPFPALLRLPVLMITHEYDARLTVLSMTLAWIVLAVIVTKLIWLLLPLLTGSEEISRTQAVAASIFLACASGGTFLTYDAGLPWVYHEVYMWAVTAAVGSIYWMIRVLLEPSRHHIKWLFVFALVAVGSRATEGWAVCLVVMAIALLMRFRPSTPARRRAWWRVLLAGAVPLAVSITINEIKFDAVFMFPLKDQVWTQISEQRRAALAANGGTLTGPQFFTTSFMAYLRPDGIRFVDYFPWVTLPAHVAPSYHGAVVDQSYRTGSVTAFMPVLLIMEAVALVAAFRPRASAALTLLRWPLLTGVLITGGVMGYGYYSTRYASEFVPALLLGGAVGTCLLVRVLERRASWRRPALGLFAVTTVFAILAQMSIGITAAAYNHRGEALERYVAWQMRYSPDQQARLVSHIDGLPEGGDTDDLAISGDCQALYLHTGDQYEPWLPVQERDRVLRIDYESVTDLKPGDATLLTVTSTREDRVDIQVNRRGQVRFVVFMDGQSTTMEWFDPPTERGLGLGIRNRIDFGAYEFEASPGGVAGFLPSVYLTEEEDSVPSLLEITEDTESLEELGLSLSVQDGLPLTLCTKLAAAAGIDVTD
jgi:hypothetical protein